ncbi:ISNCY family transposase [Candidatus Pyrohabitans sp.]
MRVTANLARELLEVLEELREEYFRGERSYPFSEWERRREQVKARLRKLPELVERAVDLLNVEEKRVGRPKALDLEQRVMLFLFARLMDKSNRDVEELLVLFSPLFGFQVSYKTIERLYSDEEVKLALHNLFVLLLQEEGVSGSFSGDGTGYSLSIARHYRSSPEKKGKDYRFVFRVMDIETGLYVAFGYSRHSEMEAFHKAVKMLEKLGIEVDSISLDKYYSSRKVLRLFGREVAVYVIPKKNFSRPGMEWSRVLRKIACSPLDFMKRYFKRNLSEAGFSADKRRFGWKIRQRREDRQETALFAVAVLHNLFTVRVNAT